MASPASATSPRAYPPWILNRDRDFDNDGHAKSPACGMCFPEPEPRGTRVANLIFSGQDCAGGSVPNPLPPRSRRGSVRSWPLSLGGSSTRISPYARVVVDVHEDSGGPLKAGARLASSQRARRGRTPDLLSGG